MPFATSNFGILAECFCKILTEQENRLAAWKNKIQKALGSNGQIIINIILQVKLIIGELPLSAAKDRFNMVFRQFFML